MLENISDINTDQLLSVTQQVDLEGYRFVTASCVDNNNGTLDLIYHYDLDGILKQFRLQVTHETVVPSISRIFYAALLVENEIKELFNVNITGIVIDYGGHLLLSKGAPESPMAYPNQITIERR